MDNRVRHYLVPESEGNGVEDFETTRKAKKRHRLAEGFIALSMLLALAAGYSRRRAMALGWTGIGERGQSMVEFALMLPVLMILLMGVMDFGRAFYFNNTISNMAREGARYATMYVRPSGNEYGRQLPTAAEVIAYTHRFENGLNVVVTVEYDGDGSDDGNRDSDGDGRPDYEDDDDDNDGSHDDEDDDDDGDGVDDEYDGDHDNDGDGQDDDEDNDDDNDGIADGEDDDDDGDGIDDDDEEHDEGYRQMSGIRVIVTVRTTYAPITPFVPNSFSMSSKAVMLTE